MPLRDHFHEPFVSQEEWPTFHHLWAAALVRLLNRRLPRPRYRVACEVRICPSVAADVAEFEDTSISFEPMNGPTAGVALAVQPWISPVPMRTVAATFPDDIEVKVHDTRDGRTLVGVIELVSPANKDREAHRNLFVAKCAACLQRGVGVIVVDIVTNRLANLHNELMAFLGISVDERFPDPSIYAVAYRPAVRQERSELDLWPVPLVVGSVLPTLPLALKGAGYVLVDFEAAYNDALDMAGLA